MTETSVLAGASAPAAGPVEITEPGLYPDLTAEDYHADPVPDGSLSSSGARKLLPPSCPALFKHEQEHGQEPRSEFDVGTAAHKLVLGDGPELVPLDFDDWRTKAAREERDEVRASGSVPLLREDYDRVHAMAAALRAHPVASKLFAPGSGVPEQSLFWRDRPTGVMRRARLDWLRHPGRGRLILPDYKTTRDASPEGVQRAMHAYGYHQQAAWYLDGAQALDLADRDAAFVFVFQEKAPPYLVTLAEPDVMALRIGRHLNRQALDLYRECTVTGRWPGYSDDIELISLPVWAENRFAEELS